MNTQAMITFEELRATEPEQCKPFVIWRWCPVCMDRTDHASECHGEWERVRCLGCGRCEEYRTR